MDDRTAGTSLDPREVHDFWARLLVSPVLGALVANLSGLIDHARHSTFALVASYTWFALVAPAATPRTIVARLNQCMVRTLGMSDVRTQLARQGVEPAPGTTEEAAAFLKKDVARWGRILKDAGITLD